MDTPIRVETTPEEISRCRYARALVEVDLRAPLCPGVWIGEEQRWQRFAYELIPLKDNFKGIVEPMSTTGETTLIEEHWHTVPPRRRPLSIRLNPGQQENIKTQNSPNGNSNMPAKSSERRSKDTPSIAGKTSDKSTECRFIDAGLEIELHHYAQWKRMKEVLLHTIRNEQAAFVQGRSIHVHTLPVQDILHSLKHRKGKSAFMAIKMDLQSAYDSVEWESYNGDAPFGVSTTLDPMGP
ncbi:hypothetical protein QJS04_geneDACA023008 [Acorus gramineus]|uniref:Reverse transcriptase n=1 Tax=Acorus gramineus TaxID=55184 RepID=A0AAV9BSS8_ACOGR|nr:hypothetical protein QJS04_geneDACA023008 [Acorus gramineus]